MLQEQGALAISIYRLLEEEEDTDDEVTFPVCSPPPQTRVVLAWPGNNQQLQPKDHVIALVQWRGEDKEKRE